MILKKIILIFILLTFFAPKSVAFENIISPLIINNYEELEIEIVVDNGQIYLPCKYILNYFEIPYKESHVNKSLLFEDVIVKQNSFIMKGIKQKTPVFFVKHCISNIQNEFFVPAKVLTKALGENITSDSNQLTVYIRTKNYHPQTKDEKDKNRFLIKDGKISAKAYDEIVLPETKGWFSLDTIGFRNNMISDSYSQIYRDSRSSNYSLNNNMQVTLKGKLNSGNYKVGLGTNSYSKNMLSFSGISPQYKNKFKNYDYLLGKTDSWTFAGRDISSDLMGFQLKDHIEKNMTYQDIDGTVHPTSTVKIYINDDFTQELSTYGGYYSLKNLYYGNKIHHIKIDELLADGTTKTILSSEFKGNINKKKIPEHDFLLGITGLQNRLWANNGNIYQTNTRKWVLGFKYSKDFSDKLHFENFIIADKRCSNSQNTAWGRSVLGHRKYLNYTTMKNLNALEGETYMGSLTYNKNDKINSKFIFGTSNSTAKDGITKDGLGYFLKYENKYKLNKNTSLEGSLFTSSPSFYMAGSSYGGMLSDRMGASIGGRTSYRNFSLSGNYSKYKSNFGNYYDGGLIDFDEYNLLARTIFKKIPSLSLKINNKKGINGIGEISSSSYELSADKRFKKLNFRGGMRKNIYSNQYSSKDYSGYTSKYSNIFTEVNFPLGKQFGNMTIGHEIIESKSDSTSNDYKLIKVSYSTPSFKGFNCNVSTGFHYTGITKGNDFGFGISKKLKSGSTISLNYRYNAIPCYIIDNMYIPGSMRHSITINFSELYGIGGFGLQSIGTANQDKGILQISAFLDINQNGVKDKNEPTIEDIPIKIDGKPRIIVLKNGKKSNLIPEEQGVHSVRIFEDKLPTLLSCCNKTKPIRHVKIDSNSKTKLEFGLISTAGSINGSVTIKDEFDNILKFDDLVVSVLNTKGREVSYTNINKDGTFSFSGLSPGKYIVTVDKEIQNLYRITPEKNTKNYVIEIPPEYKKYINIDNVNLYYKYEL